MSHHDTYNHAINHAYKALPGPIATVVREALTGFTYRVSEKNALARAVLAMPATDWKEGP